MSALGQYLLEQRWIEEAQLSDALLHQQELGGRLGTSLLEKGYLSEDQLLQALSAQQGVPVATAADLADIDPAVTGLLAPKLASRHLAIPFRAAGSRVDLAVARTDNLGQLDDLSFIMGKTLRPHIAVEARLYMALYRYYRVPCPRRFVRLVERLDRPIQPVATGPRRSEADEKAPRRPARSPSAVPAERLQQGPRRVVPGLKAPQQRSIPLTEDQRRALQSTAVPAGREASAAERLADATSPEEIGRLLLAALDEHFVHTLLFRVARGSVFGWLGHGPGIDRDWLASYSVGLRQATVFRQVDSERVFRGVLVSNPAHDILARCWGGGLDSECLVTSVRIRGRMVCLVYGDRGASGLGGLDTAAVDKLTARAGLAFERLILDRKLRG